MVNKKKSFCHVSWLWVLRSPSFAPFSIEQYSPQILKNYVLPLHMDTKASNIDTIDYILMNTSHGQLQTQNIHIDIKTLDTTYYRVMNAKHGKLQTHEHRHKHGHKT